MRKIFYGLSFLFFTSCQAFPANGLRSTTYIKSKEAFILGNNKHNQFSVQLKNTSDTAIFISIFPAGSMVTDSLLVKKKQTIRLDVESNMALKIRNPSQKQIAVQLKVKGDTGLSMGY